MITKLTGNEHYSHCGADLPLTVLDFWQWSNSDLISNTSRGILAEFLVASAVGDTSPVREDWLPYDVTTPSGRRVEVKSAAYVQSWDEDYHDHITFDIAPKRAWTPQDGMADVKKRNCDLYVFCLWTAESKAQSVLDLDLWDFYVLPTSAINAKSPDQKSIGLQSLLKLSPVKADYSSLGDVIESIQL